MNRTITYLLAGTLALMIIATAFAGGMLFSRFVEDYKVPGVSQASTTVGDRVDEVRALLNRQALSPADETSLTAGAIQGMLEGGGDAYATYFNPDHYEYFSEMTDGAFYGIGVNIAEKDGKVYIVSVIEDTPAEAVGLEANDEFRAIDETRREVFTSEEVVKLVRGEAGTDVNVTVFRPSDKKEHTFTVTRAKIDIPNVMTRLLGPDKNVGYLRMLSFNAQSAAELSDSINELAADGATTFVLDLRDNPGGLLSSAVDVASLFVEDGVIVRIEARNKPEDEMRANGRIPAYSAAEVPLVMLINENSASASEVLGGALQDYKRATLVGTKSFGKGSVQTIEELSFGGAVKFTTAHYLTPKSRVIDGKGLVPDVTVEMKPELQADEKTDTQLAKAIELATEAAE
ncbi:MAG: S41 family peptidase [Coriobacteriia bacterium]